MLNNLRFKDLIQDLVLLKRGKTDALRAKYEGLLTPEQTQELIDGLEPYLAKLLLEGLDPSG